PKDVPKVTWAEAGPNDAAAAGRGGFGGGGFGGGQPAPTVPSITKRLVGRVDNSACPSITVNISLTLTLPKDAPGPVPVMIAVGLIGSSGAGGAKLFRRNFGEQVENLTGSGEYHWMSGTFLKYGGPLAPCDLPVDAHELIALCAPRPTFISYGAMSGQGAEGTWVDQKGSFLAAVAAGPAFTLLGKKDLGATEMPAANVGGVDGDLPWRMHRR